MYGLMSKICYDPVSLEKTPPWSECLVPQHLWLELTLQASRYPNISRYWAGTDSIHWPKITPPSGIEKAPHPEVRI